MSTIPVSYVSSARSVRRVAAVAAVLVFVLPVVSLAQYGQTLKQQADTAKAKAYNEKTSAANKKTAADNKKIDALLASTVATDGYAARSGTMSPQQLQVYDDAMASASIWYSDGDNYYCTAVERNGLGNDKLAAGNTAYAAGNYITARDFYDQPVLGEPAIYSAYQRYHQAHDNWDAAYNCYHNMMQCYLIAWNQTNPP